MSEVKKVKFEAPDISVYQGNVNFKNMRDAGYDHVGIRAGYGKNNVDQKFVTNALACVNLGLTVMLYWFSYAYTVAMAAAEAGYAIAQAKKYWKRCPIAFDLEGDSRRWAAQNGVNIDKKLATDMAVAFLREVKNAGYIPVIYTNRDYLKNYFDMNRITAELGVVYVWFALYGVNNLPASELKVTDLWQYTSKGRIPGINGNVDISRVYTDIWTGCEPVTVTATKTEYGSYTVKKGDTLSKIGVNLKTAWKDIADANNMKSPYTIYPGQVLKVPYTVNVTVTDQEPKPNLYIKSFQAAASADGYKDSQGKALEENGIDDVATQFVRKQISLQAKRVKLLWIERSEGKLVEWLQGRLKEALGIALEVTGEYDADTVKAVKDFQTKYGLAADGIAEYNTIQMMFFN